MISTSNVLWIPHLGLKEYVEFRRERWGGESRMDDWNIVIKLKS